MISESTPKTNTAEKNTRYAIVGGGIAGLATAYQLQKKLASESQYGHPVTIDVFEKGSAESYHAGESAKRASLGESPARTMRMSGGAFNVRATKAMIDDLQQFLDTATENGQLAALGLEAFKGRQLFQPVENIYIGKADELTNESSKYATNKAAFAKTNTLIEEISGLELKQRYRGTQNATGDTPRSIYENIADDAAVLIEKAYDPVSNPEGVSGVMDYEAILNVLVAKLRNHPTVPALIHFGHQVTPARLDAKQAYQETADGMVTLQIADTQQPLEKITQSFDKLIIAPGEAI
ncbi:MAG: FAD-dependent oxidoreductase, partial [Rickettsiales bacterium]|nr:FAD-dependent oxidoreductase [Rickettsiales bacterium]